MPDAWIIDAVRTPRGIGKYPKGALSQIHPQRLGSTVLKALAEYKNMTLGDLLEGIVLHAFDGKAPFSAKTLRKIAELKGIYELDLDSRTSHRLTDQP